MGRPPKHKIKLPRWLQRDRAVTSAEALSARAEHVEVEFGQCDVGDSSKWKSIPSSTSLQETKPKSIPSSTSPQEIKPKSESKSETETKLESEWESEQELQLQLQLKTELDLELDLDSVSASSSLSSSSLSLFTDVSDKEDDV
ncbi:hypothetical protein DSL72_003658 [Monilinia vaccinii-corymbosi]|uniref:Uncharacterized protein n=1 Tax=Monilinia vaccinii-corymbosi TaxID=61207 RepID=A0A8A3P980_9HELO|nr:hypothetical protein DSL72_003658 [Monilinia vaccinii-corymbosi]